MIIDQPVDLPVCPVDDPRAGLLDDRVAGRSGDPLVGPFSGPFFGLRAGRPVGPSASCPVDRVGAFLCLHFHAMNEMNRNAGNPVRSSWILSRNSVNPGRNCHRGRTLSFLGASGV